ncbi:hypothetical protein MVEN_01645700 [Mycena venus]|uniref:Brain protein I3 n=1 Tax=Mycena venus TaxID=2733690 RepID=A0A8H6XR61_9AGAR|nr:hypothetical protein MVEN_01645700 [Mycena venus]
MSTPYPQDKDAPPYPSAPTPQGPHTIVQPGYPVQGDFPQEYPPQQQYAPQQQQYASQQQQYASQQQQYAPQPNPVAIGDQYRANLYAQCAQGMHQSSRKFGVFGIVMAVLFFPFGFICLFWDMQIKCDRCGVKLA